MEVIEPTITLKLTGFLLGGLILYIINKSKDTYNMIVLDTSIIGEKNRIWNLKNPLTLFNIPNIRANKRIGPHNKEIISVIIGSLLGDCYGNKKSREGVRFVYKQAIKNKQYLFWLYDFFYKRGYCTNLLPREYTTTLKKADQIKQYFGYGFNTFTFRSLNWIYNMFYSNGKKTISINKKIEEYIDPLALSIWIMDDGGWTNYGVRISTNSFTLEEIEFLVKVLKDKYELNCTIQKIETVDQYSIYIKAESIYKLRELVQPYMHKSMNYKLGIK